jgi:hypothetical protein
VKLTYKIPHKVTLRMVGPQFVGVCTCGQWAKNTNPRKYDGLAAGWYPNGFLPSPVEDLIKAGHEHASDHVFEHQGIARKVAA